MNTTNLQRLFNSSSPTGKLDNPLKEHIHIATQVHFKETGPDGDKQLEVWWLLHRIFCLPTRPVWERVASFEEGDE